MLIVKIPREYYKNRLPSDDFYLEQLSNDVRGVVYQKDKHIFVIPFFEGDSFNEQLESHRALFPLQKDKYSSHRLVLDFDHTLVFQADQFLKYIKAPALLLPFDYQALKESQYLIRDKLFTYISEFLVTPHHERFKHSMLHEFKKELDEMNTKALKESPQNVLPFFDVNTKEEYEFMAKNVDSSRIAKKDIQEFGKVKKTAYNVHDNLEMEM